MELSAKFDKPSYFTGDQVKITITVKNVSTAQASGLHATGFGTTDDGLQLDYPQTWGELGSGATLDPQESVSATLTAHEHKLGGDVAKLIVLVTDSAHHSIKQDTFSVPITQRYGHAGGLVFGDVNNNGKADAGEGLAGAKITLSYGQYTKYEATTGDNGRFSFAKIPTGTYFASGTAADGWSVAYKAALEIDESDDNDDLQFRAMKSVKDALTPSVKFTQDTYQPGDVAHVTVILSNKTSGPLTGLNAYCNRVGNGNQLHGTGPGWGALATGTLNLAAGETKTLDVSESVPEAALTYGKVAVSCDFGYSGIDDADRPNAFDEANVPGGFGDINGEVANYPEGTGTGKPRNGIAGTRVVLTDDRHCPIVSETTTNANGDFVFTHLPAGQDYKLYFFLPTGWKVKYDTTTGVLVFDKSVARLGVEAVPGEGTAPTLPAQPADCGPVPSPENPVDVTPAAHTGLAYTGANVVGLALFGGITLVVGAGVLIAARRRRSV